MSPSTTICNFFCCVHKQFFGGCVRRVGYPHTWKHEHFHISFKWNWVKVIARIVKSRITSSKNGICGNILLFHMLECFANWIDNSNYLLFYDIHLGNPHFNNMCFKLFTFSLICT